MADYYDSRSYARPHHDSSCSSSYSSYSYPSYPRSRDIDPYSRHAHHHAPPSVPASKLTAMRSSVTPPSNAAYNRYAAPSSYSSYYRPGPRQSPRWPPSPSAEDEASALAKEVKSEGSLLSDDGNGVVRGTVDQNPIIEENESLDRRFVLVTDPTADHGRSSDSNARERRRKSFAERGGMHHLNTRLDDPPVITERVSTPYSYTKPQKETLAPTPTDYFLSPESTIPSAASIPRSVPSRDTGSDQRHQSTASSSQPTTTIPVHSRYDSFTQSPRAPQNDVFDDSDLETEDTTRLRTERKPARYSFAQSDLQKEHLRTDPVNQYKPQPSRRDSGTRQRSSRNPAQSQSSGSSKSSSQDQSPRSSSSSLNDTSRRPRQAPSDTGYTSVPHPSMRPASPLQRAPSPKLPPRRPTSPNASRPSSRSGPGSASPLSYLTTLPPPSPGRGPVTEADWHSAFPAAPPVTERTRPSSRFSRQESIPAPAPRIGIQSPSPARPAKAENPLPYPVDDRPGNVFMPPEEHYQYDHATNSPIAASPRQLYPESPRVSSSSIPPSPRERSSAFRPNLGTRQTAPEDLPRMSRTRSSSLRSQSSVDGRRERPNKGASPLSLGKPLPSCPRSEPTKHDDWYTLENTQGFDVCPSCYEGVFGETPFKVYFTQTRRYEPRTERVCDFSSPWVRLAWLLTIKQRRPSLDLIYALADIQDTLRPCPGDRELSTDRADWFGIPDPRDGIHVANFAICSCDVRSLEALFPSIRGYFTRLPTSTHIGMQEKYLCSLRLSSRRFPKYLDLLVELDAEAQLNNQRPDITRFVQLARENAFKGECNRGKASFRKPWYYMPTLPELTVCEECYDEIIWPAMQSKTTPNTIPRLFNKSIQMVPNEDPDVGSSCCLYSPRMRRIFDTSVKEEDLPYLKRKAIDRKRAEGRLTRERKGIVNWMADLERGSREWERAKSELREVEKEWAVLE